MWVAGRAKLGGRAKADQGGREGAVAPHLASRPSFSVPVIPPGLRQPYSWLPMVA